MKWHVPHSGLRPNTVVRKNLKYLYPVPGTRVHISLINNIMHILIIVELRTNSANYITIVENILQVAPTKSWHTNCRFGRYMVQLYPGTHPCTGTW